MFTVSVTATPAEALSAVLDRIVDMTPAMGAIAENSELAAKARITITKMSPNGDAWQDWRPRTLRERTRSGTVGNGLLWDTGELLNSINSVFAEQEVAVGTDVEYAEDLQDGNPSMRLVPRPFLGWSAEEMNFAAAAITEWVNAARIIA